MTKFQKFLALVPTAHWRQPPSVWGEELRRALNDHLVKVGWGGILELTPEGQRARKEGSDETVR